jgi:FPC/CPF motif-containing protein YcgG
MRGTERWAPDARDSGAMQGTDVRDEVDADFRAFVGAKGFPCLAGKGAVNRGDYTLGVYGDLGSEAAARALAGDLAAFVASLPADGAGLQAFAAVFTGAVPADEQAFEAALWQQLQRLHEADPVGHWDPLVSADPDDGQFSFSFGGRALFVVGLHPTSSRLARQFRWPAMMFNPRAQFDRLRREGQFERMRGLVRDRDIALQGTMNPNLADFGHASEARQYSGRATEPEWQCPFHHRES